MSLNRDIQFNSTWNRIVINHIQNNIFLPKQEGLRRHQKYVLLKGGHQRSQPHRLLNMCQPHWRLWEHDSLTPDTSRMLTLPPSHCNTKQKCLLLFGRGLETRSLKLIRKRHSHLRKNHKRQSRENLKKRLNGTEKVLYYDTFDFRDTHQYPKIWSISCSPTSGCGVSLHLYSQQVFILLPLFYAELHWETIPQIITAHHDFNPRNNLGFSSCHRYNYCMTVHIQIIESYFQAVGLYS